MAPTNEMDPTVDRQVETTSNNHEYESYEVLLPETPANPLPLTEVKKEQPTKKAAYWAYDADGIVTAMSYCTGAAHLWYFPEALGRHGLLFLLQYVVCYVFVGIPVTYLEMALGQYTNTSFTTIFQNIAPAMEGVALAMLFMMALRLVTVTADIAMILTLFGESMKRLVHPDVQWKQCTKGINSRYCYNYNTHNKCGEVNYSNVWNASEECREHTLATVMTTPYHLRTTPVLDYVLTNTLPSPFTADEYGWPSFSVLCCTFVVWLFCACIFFFGTRAVGRVAYAFVTIPPLAFLMFLIYGAISAPKNPLALMKKVDFMVMLSLHSWSDAMLMTMMSLGLGNGGLMNLASHNKFQHNVVVDVIATAVYGFLMNIVLALCVFLYGAELSKNVYGQTIVERVAISNAHGHFAQLVMFAEVMASQPTGRYLTPAFFFIAAFFTLQQALIPFAVVCSTILHRFPSMLGSPGKRLKNLFLFSLIGFTVTIPFITPGGAFQSALLTRFLALGALLTCFFELVTVMHIYGFRRFITNVQTMLNRTGPVSWYWWVNWTVVAPLLILSSLIAITYTLIVDDMAVIGYLFPVEMKLFGWTIVVQALCWIPAVMLMRCVRCRKDNLPFKTTLQPTANWGPLNEEDQLAAQHNERALRVR